MALAQSAIKNGPALDKAVFRTTQHRVLWTLLDRCCTTDAKTGNITSWVQRPLPVVLAEVTEALQAESSRPDAVATPALDLVAQLEMDANRMYMGETRAHNIGPGHIYADAWRETLHARTVDDLVSTTFPMRSNHVHIPGIAPWMAFSTDEFPALTWSELVRRDSSLGRKVQEPPNSDRFRRAKMDLLLDVSEEKKKRQEYEKSALERFGRLLSASESRARFEAHRELQTMWRQFLVLVCEDAERRLRGVLTQADAWGFMQLPDYHSESAQVVAPGAYRKAAEKLRVFFDTAFKERNVNKARVRKYIDTAIAKWSKPKQFQKWEAKRLLSDPEQKLVVEYNRNVVNAELYGHMREGARITYECTWQIASMIESLQQTEPDLFFQSGAGPRGPHTFQASLETALNAAKSYHQHRQQCRHWIDEYAQQVQAVRGRVYNAAAEHDARTTIVDRLQTIKRCSESIGEGDMTIAKFRDKVNEILGLDQLDNVQTRTTQIDDAAKIERDLLAASAQDGSSDAAERRQIALQFLRTNAPALCGKTRNEAATMYVLSVGHMPNNNEDEDDAKLETMSVASSNSVAVSAHSYAPIRHSRVYAHSITRSVDIDTHRMVAKAADTKTFKETMQELVIAPTERALRLDEHGERTSLQTQWRMYFEKVAFLRAQIPPSLHDLEEHLAAAVYPACIALMYFIAYRRGRSKPLPQSYTDEFV